MAGFTSPLCSFPCPHAAGGLTSDAVVSGSIAFDGVGVVAPVPRGQTGSMSVYVAA